MKGDFSCDSFDPSKHFARVLLQQGRVLTDADFNEQAAIQRELLRAFVAYLEGWERAVSAAEDPALRDPALGGVNTSVRGPFVWRVRRKRSAAQRARLRR